MEFCEECETQLSTIKCVECEQNICEQCDKIIHNKGKRAKHVREPKISEKIIVVCWDHQSHPDQDLSYTSNSLREQSTKLGGKAQIYLYTHQSVYNKEFITIKVNSEENIQKKIIFDICSHQETTHLIYSFCHEQSKLTLLEYIRKSKSQVFLLTTLTAKPIQLIDQQPQLPTIYQPQMEIQNQQRIQVSSKEGPYMYNHPRYHSAGIQGFEGSQFNTSLNQYNKPN